MTNAGLSSSGAQYTKMIEEVARKTNSIVMIKPSEMESFIDKVRLESRKMVREYNKHQSEQPQ